MSRMSVLLTTEGTYPFHQGGVSTWCHMLINQLPSIDFTVFSVMTDPFVAQKFELSPQTDLIRMPLWGTEEPSEHLNVKFSSTYLSKQRTTEEVIRERFLPLFERLVLEVIALEKNPYQFASTITEMYDFFTEFDYKVCFKSPLTWDKYKEIMFSAVESGDYELTEPDVYCMVQSLGWLYRFFNVINTRVPKTTIAHSSAAAFCGLPCVVAKVKYGTPFLLTEHGVYLREQYISLSKYGYPSFLNTFLIRLVQSVVNVNYAFADQISPVCEYNTRWEKRLTGAHHRIKVIYNGVDHVPFQNLHPPTLSRPTVVTVARVDPIKDMVTLLHAAKETKREIADVQFLIYGSVAVPDYYEKCLALVKELDLEDTVFFKGHTTDVAKVLEMSDVVVQTSISEAFPYSIVEAMFAGKAIVSTDVGGIPEAIADTGILVPTADPAAVSDALVKLLRNPEERQELGTQARERALRLFTLHNFLENHMKTYLALAVSGASQDVPQELQGRDIAQHAQEKRTEGQHASQYATEHEPRQPLEQHGLERMAQQDGPRRGLELVPGQSQDAPRGRHRRTRQNPWQPAGADGATSAGANGARAASAGGAGAARAASASAGAAGAAGSAAANGAGAGPTAAGTGSPAASDKAFGLHWLHAEHAYALSDCGFVNDAIVEMKLAINACPNTDSTKVFLLDLAQWYLTAGKPQHADDCVVKFELLSRIS
jgi:polysaccharide biosynthesis protein PelF